MKTCVKCLKTLKISDFNTRDKGKYIRRTCRSCETTARLARFRRQEVDKSSPTFKKRLERSKKYNKIFRQNTDNVAKCILRDCENTDRKKGMTCDLTAVFIEQQIGNGCHYCGSSNVRMTMDMIDNAKGHTIENVVPSCYLCNKIRSDMPYAAWLELVPVIKRATEAGLFGEWVGNKKIDANVCRIDRKLS